MDIPEADAMRMFCEKHAAALSRYAFQLTGDQICAENVVQEQGLGKVVFHQVSSSLTGR